MAFLTGFGACGRSYARENLHLFFMLTEDVCVKWILFMASGVWGCLRARGENSEGHQHVKCVDVKQCTVKPNHFSYFSTFSCMCHLFPPTPYTHTHTVSAQKTSGSSYSDTPAHWLRACNRSYDWSKSAVSSECVWITSYNLNLIKLLLNTVGLHVTEWEKDSELKCWEYFLVW